MIAQIVYLEVQPDQLEAFLQEALSNASASRDEEGVVQFDVLQQEKDPFKFMFYELYKGAEALQAHRNTPHFKRWAEKGVPLLSGERVRVMYEKLD